MTATRKRRVVPVGRAADRIAKREVDYGLDDRLLPIDAVIQLAGIGKTMIYRKVREGTFPVPCKPGGCSTRWSEREVKTWRDDLLAARPAA
ncbi:helix-turn-helix transcriptional regulator [Sphingomonas endolithica]|uniref:helix-turn-helix transcriptional regulator n=1 Tax=Sphingomonas endolithica TaxID=2972485 RepID=UPI0021AFFFF5|nr:AlpA family phage regulatory protein [Sphingomonas sp. ZFBP2030]